MEVKILISRWKSKKVGFKFDMYAWFLLCEDNGIEIHQLGDLKQEDLYADLIYCAYRSYCTDKLIKAKISKERLLELVDLMTKGDAEQLASEILKSKVFGKSVAEHAEGVKKKKSPGVKS